MEFKNLAEVTQLTEVPEGVGVLAATIDGDIVRVPGDGLGGSKASGPVFALDPGSGSYPVIGCDTTFEELVDNYKNCSIGTPKFIMIDPETMTSLYGTLISMYGIAMMDGFESPIPSPDLFKLMGQEEMLADIEIASMQFTFLVYSPTGYEMPPMTVVCTAEGFELAY